MNNMALPLHLEQRLQALAARKGWSLEQTVNEAINALTDKMNREDNIRASTPPMR